MPEEDDDEYSNRKEMRCFEELVVEVPVILSVQSQMDSIASSPERTERCNGQPSLKYQRNDACPVENCGALGDLFDHVVVPDVKDDEWERMHQCEDEEAVSRPSVEDLQLLVGHPRHKRDPICFACSGTEMLVFHIKE
jgi:hypothetical protein